MSSANSDSFTTSSPIWIPFISFTSLIAVSRTSKTMLNSSSEGRHPCLVPDLRQNSFSFSPLRRMLALGFSYTPLQCCSGFPLCPLSARFLSEMGVGFCQRLFPHVLRGSYVFNLQFVNVVYHTDGSVDIEERSHPWDKSHLIEMYNPFNVLLDLVC
uniref:Uncharacterized protein n=1 Tax=Sus scrofa TaxID=9823 RepID=A0A8D0MR91_PIG